MLPGIGEDAPTIVLTAHYDSFGLVPVSHIKMISENKGSYKIYLETTIFVLRCPFVVVYDSGCPSERILMEAESPSC